MTLECLGIHWGRCQAEHVILGIWHVYNFVRALRTFIHCSKLWISYCYFITSYIILNLDFNLSVSQSLLVALFTIHHFWNCWFIALSTIFHNFKAIRNDIWKLIEVLIFFSLFVIYCTFNWSWWRVTHHLFVSWTLNLLNLLNFLLFNFSTVLPTINIAYNVHLILECFMVDVWWVISRCKLDCLLNGIHSLISSLRLNRLVQKLSIINFIVLICVFPSICLLTDWFAQSVSSIIDAFQ